VVQAFPLVDEQQQQLARGLRFNKFVNGHRTTTSASVSLSPSGGCSR
jgi:hypothetical protein